MKLNLLFLSFVLFIVFGPSSAVNAQQWPVEIVKTNINGGILPGNFDNDNDIDLLIGNGDTLFWYENLQPGWSEHIIDTQFFDVIWIGVIDIDRDGDMDVLQLSISNPGTIAWNENIMNGAQWEKHIISDSVNQPSNIPRGYGDIDGDNDIDIALPSTGDGTILWFENVVGDTIWHEHKIAVIGSYAIWTTLADMDGDNDLDIIGARYSKGQIIWYENQLPDTSWKPHPIATLPGTAQGIGVDMDEDGDNDIITHSNISNVLVWYENPSWNQHTIASGINGLWMGPVGDINQDGNLDVSFGSQSLIGWCKNLGDALSWETYVIDTVSNKYPFPYGLADINGDSSLDLIVYILSPPGLNGDVRWYANPNQPTEVLNISNGLPRKFNLSQNYPNPFNPSTIIEFNLPKSGFVTLRIYNLLGEEVAKLVSENLTAGKYRYDWNANKLTSGVYFYRITAGDPSASSGQDYVETKKMILLR